MNELCYKFSIIIIVVLFNIGIYNYIFQTYIFLKSLSDVKFIKFTLYNIFNLFLSMALSFVIVLDRC